MNAAINKAAGPSLDKATKKKYGFSPIINAGDVLPVKVPAESPLFQKQGVEYVFHVLAPNMNPKRPNCLRGDYAKGCALLKRCYAGMSSQDVALHELTYLLLVFVRDAQYL